MVHQIFYVSSARTNGITEEMIDQILFRSRQYNPRHGITGVLLFRGGLFLQLLEGPRTEVEALYQKIERDSRHSNIIKLLEIDSEQRVFANWSMGYKKIEDLDIRFVNEILSWNKLISGREKIEADLILTMLDRFRSRANQVIEA